MRQGEDGAGQCDAALHVLAQRHQWCVDLGGRGARDQHRRTGSAGTCCARRTTRGGCIGLLHGCDACSAYRADDVYETAQGEFSEQERVDLTMAVVAINGWNRLLVSFRVLPAVARNA
jgi:hypothetical protein